MATIFRVATVTVEYDHHGNKGNNEMYHGEWDI